MQLFIADPTMFKKKKKITRENLKKNEPQKLPKPFHSPAQPTAQYSILNMSQDLFVSLSVVYVCMWYI